MDIISILIVFLVGILISVCLNHFFPRFTMPLIQIIIGIAIGLSSYGKHIELEPELIMVMIIAPLLFNESKNADTTKLYKNIKDILFLSFPMVIITVLILGIFFDYMLPAIPIAACFALAASLSPTDIITVSSLSKRLEIPEKNKIILEGEGLINDASGITTFQIAVLALVSGEFSVMGSLQTLIIISIGGIVIGAIFQTVKSKINSMIRRSGIEDTKFFIIFDILTPFLSYVIAEHFHVSGVLAVVTIGILEAMTIKRNSLFDAKLKSLSDSTWDVLSTVLNAIVFLYLGAQLPRILEEVNIDSVQTASLYIAIMVIATIALFLIRFVFFILYKIVKKKGIQNINLKEQIIMTLSGVKGTVTLATVTSLPFVLSANQAFEDRSLVIFIASGIIILSILTSVTILPLFLEDKEEDSSANLEIYIAQKTADLLREEINDENHKEIDAVLKVYYTRIKKMRIQNSELNYREQRKLEKIIFRKTIEIERKELDKLLNNDEIDTDMYIGYLRMLRRFTQRSGKGFSISLALGGILLRKLVPSRLHKKKPKVSKELYGNIKEIFIHNHYQVIDMIEGLIDEKNESYLRVKIKEEQRLIRMIENDEFLNINNININPNYTKEMEKGFQFERNIIQNLFENGIINYDKSLELKQNVNLMEEYYMNDTSNNLAYYFLNNMRKKS